MAFNAILEMTARGVAKIVLSGDLDASAAPTLKTEVENAASQGAKRLVLRMDDLDYMASAGLRVLIFAKQKMGPNVDIFIVGAQEMVKDTIEKTGFHQSVVMVDTYDPDQIENI
jgi:anti-anti-sigma factor